jgi:hypothetical protein
MQVNNDKPGVWSISLARHFHSTLNAIFHDYDNCVMWMFQADFSGWVACYSMWMLQIAIELSLRDPYKL